ncbi:Crp/Fnr family transcriptional regulator [Taklimakanibacter lacteus]|uniref:Crp/Fnr family transcriptional regulator n=1 Tax=Taklimakanibacter lacteus TaxID=2268456 RepID=UPI000E673313
MLKTDPVFTIIARTEPFSELASPNMQALAGLCRMRRYGKGEVIFHMGEPGDALYGIKSGRVRTTILSPDGREMTLNLFGPQSTFGIVGFFDGGPRMASAIVLEPSEIFRLPRGDFLSFIAAHPEVAVHVIGYLCGKLRSIKERVGETALLPLAASLAHRLLTLAEEFGDEIPASQEQLASFVSASRESVNRQLQHWKRQKIVSLHRGGLHILDHGRLEQEATVLGA